MNQTVIQKTPRGTERSQLYRWLSRTLRDAGTRLSDRHGAKRVWIDIGAHLGETTMREARMDPALTVYAFEPNWNLVRQMIGQLPNFVVFPMAVSERDGVSNFFLNAEDEASSLLDFDPEGLQRWNGGESLRIESKIAVPTIRLDTFMRDMNIQTVDYLKIDAQGADFTVIRSAGARLNDIRKIKLEVDITPVHLYQGSAGREEVAAHMEERGFVLNGAEVQSLGQEENLTFVQRTRPD